MKLIDLAQQLHAELEGPGDIEITGVAGIREAQSGEITFVSDKRSLKDLETCRASAVIVSKDAPALTIPSIRIKNPRLAFARVLGIFYAKPFAPEGISDRAIIANGVVIGRDVTIHAFVVIESGSKIGDRVTLHPGVTIGSGSSVGDDCEIHPNASIYHGTIIGNRVIIHAGTVIGSDGFGFVTDGGKHHKIPQVGGVVVEDDVEIGANCMIDRATLGTTVVGKGTKIDNGVHIAHNVVIGEHCLLAAQVGIAGSTHLGKQVVFGGQVGVADHIVIGDRVMAGGGAGITRDVAEGQLVAGHIAIPLQEWMKVQAVLPKLPELRRRIMELERTVMRPGANTEPKEGKTP
jgi:UDP-3-O-[3-hydroxymyristoyl] glucosamine N-acyltransferase